MRSFLKYNLTRSQTFIFHTNNVYNNVNIQKWYCDVHSNSTKKNRIEKADLTFSGHKKYTTKYQKATTSSSGQLKCWYIAK